MKRKGVPVTPTLELTSFLVDDDDPAVLFVGLLT